MVKTLLPQEEYLRSLPRKRVSVAAIIVCDGKILIVKPNYKDCWLLPGGTVDELETPLAALRREIEEELGLRSEITRLLVTDYCAEANARSGAEEVLHFAFDVRLSESDLGSIVLQEEELTQYELVEPTKLDDYLTPRSARRTRAALQALQSGNAVYTEEGYIKA